MIMDSLKTTVNSIGIVIVDIVRFTLMKNTVLLFPLRSLTPLQQKHIYSDEHKKVQTDKQTDLCFSLVLRNSRTDKCIQGALLGLIIKFDLYIMEKTIINTSNCTMKSKIPIQFNISFALIFKKDQAKIYAKIMSGCYFTCTIPTQD
jgi:hypothetical protein